MFLFLNFSNTYSRFLQYILMINIYFVLLHFFFSKLKKHYPIYFIRVHLILEIICEKWLFETKIILVYTYQTTSENCYKSCFIRVHVILKIIFGNDFVKQKHFWYSLIRQPVKIVINHNCEKKLEIL